MKTKWIVTIALLVIAHCGCRSARPVVISIHQPDFGKLFRSEDNTNADIELPGKQSTANQVSFQTGSTQAPSSEKIAVEVLTSSQDIDRPAVLEMDKGLTLSQLEQLALATNPAVSEVQSEIESLRGKLTQAGLPPNPKVGVMSEDINEDRGAGKYGVFFGREIVRGNKLGLSQSTVCAEIRAAEQRLAVMQQRLITDVNQRFYNLLVAQEKVTVAEELVKISQNAVDTSTKLFEAKEAARTAVLQSELELQNADVVKRQAENERLAARRKLAGMIGESDLPSGGVTGNVREAIELADFEQSFDQLVNDSPEIAALFAEVDQARRKLARECAEPIPNLTWQTNLLYDTVGDGVVAGFQLGMPIPILNRNQGSIYQARHQITAAQRKAEKKALDIRQRLATAFENYLDARLQVDAYDSNIIPKAKETFDLVSKGYEQGETDFLQLLTAQRTYSQINLMYLDKLQQLWQQNVEIKGMLLNGSLQ